MPPPYPPHLAAQPGGNFLNPANFNDLCNNFSEASFVFSF
jgi:hypothetical protein